MKEIEPQNSKERFEAEFEELFNDPLVPVEWDYDRKEKVKEITGDSRIIHSRVASIPMSCRGSQCPMAKTCPLYKEDLHPFGERCPIEAKLVAQLMYGIMKELEVDPESIIEVGMVRDIVDQEIQQIRKQSILSNEDIITENVIGIDDSGDPIMKKELNLAVDWEDKIHKRKAALLKQLVATRESRINAGARVIDQAANMANIMNSFAKLQKKDLELAENMGLIPKDDYIEAQIALQEKSDDEDIDSNGQ